MFGYQSRGFLQVGGDMLDMKNAFLSSPSSQYFTTGNADFQTMKRNVVPEMAQNLGFCMVNQLIDGDFANPFDHSISHSHLNFPGFSSNCDGLTQQSVEDDDLLSQKTSYNLVERSSTGAKRCRDSSTRIKTASSEEHSHPQPHDPTKLPLPVRRSQKLADKITVLQKLVSPYGKTNTAAVLEEASLYIKHLQQQIETLSGSHKTDAETQEQEDGEGARDLRSRGLCLVPVSFSSKVTADKDPANFLEKIKVPRKF